MTADVTPVYKKLDKVRVRPVGMLRRLFISNHHRRLIGKVGTIIRVEVGAYSKNPLYSVMFETGAYVFFGEEIEPVQIKEDTNNKKPC